MVTLRTGNGASVTMKTPSCDRIARSQVRNSPSSVTMSVTIVCEPPYDDPRPQLPDESRGATILTPPMNANSPETRLVASIVLAAGKGTRMRSDLPKCLHPVAGVPMVELVVEALREGVGGRTVVVVGHRGELLVKTLRRDGEDAAEIAWQREQKGTGHAVSQAKDALAGFCGDVVVAAGDTPLITERVLRDLLAKHREEGADLTVATAVLEDPTGYGRIVRDLDGTLQGIVEHKDAEPAVREIREVNAGLYVFRSEALWPALEGLSADNAQGEYYLTDTVLTIREAGGRVVPLAGDDPDILLGVNDRTQLAAATAILRRRTEDAASDAGAILVDPQTTYVSPLARLGAGSRIEPGTHILGRTTIGEGTVVGPNTVVKNSTVGKDGAILMSHVDRAEIGDRVKVGPYANLRPKTVLKDGVRVGDFVEIKNATLHEDAKANHLAYIGDAEVGARSNLGAGTITCNYDGVDKHRTTIGADVFVGSNSTLVAPLNLGDGAMVAAGSVITRDVEPGAGAFGRARQENKEGWVQRWRSRLSELRALRESKGDSANDSRGSS